MPEATDFEPDRREAAARMIVNDKRRMSGARARRLARIDRFERRRAAIDDKPMEPAGEFERKAARMRLS